MTTTLFWVTAILLLAGALLFVLPPLLRPPPPAASAVAPGAVYREQRQQLDRELALGQLSAAQHAAALDELQARVVEEVAEAPTLAAEPPSRRMQRLVTLLVALLLPAGAATVYAVLGRPDAIAPAAVAEPAHAGGGTAHTMTPAQIEDMVARLAERLQKSPGDAEGWHMLARSYMALSRLPEAAQAYDRASRLSPRDPQLLADHADALAMVNGRRLEGRPLELVNAALEINPAHPKSLSLAGTAAFNEGDFARAASLWRRLQATLPADSDQARSVGTLVAQSEAAAARGAGSAAPAPTPGIDGEVLISDALRARLTPGATLFVFARPADGSRMPVAIQRLSADGFPRRFRLDDSQAMSPQTRLSGQREVVLSARISRSGNATPQSGDLTGSAGTVQVGAQQVRLLIDQVLP